MDFRKRLFIAFIVMTIFPILLICGVGMLVLRYQSDSLQKGFDTQIDSAEALQNPVLLMNRVMEETFAELKELAESNPEGFLNVDYLKALDEKLRKQQTFLVVEKDEEMIYCGNERAFEVIHRKLPATKDFPDTADSGFYVSGRVSCLVKQVDFEFFDGADGTAYIISNVTYLLPQTRKLMLQFLIAVVIVFLIAGLLLIIWLYTGIVRPIYKLKDATTRMKEGDLDFIMEKTGEDEIGELSKDFEEMRAHLKGEIDGRIDYDQELRDLVGNISHDLKTPLTTIKGYAEGVIDGVADTPEKQMKYLKMIRQKAEDMTRLVEELSLYTQIDCRNYPYHFKRIYLMKFFLDCIEEETLELEERNIRLDIVNMLSKDIEIQADSEQLKRVVMNIVGNSAKYMGGKPGSILFHLAEDGDYVRIEISDNGPGILEKDLPHIFERFYRGDVSRNSGSGGSGIGLSIVKRIIEDHGGTISARSKPSEGTTISFTLLKADRRDKKNRALVEPRPEL